MTDFTSILKWYRGKALAAVRDEAIPLLQQSEAQEYWVPKASRRVRALLRKTHRAENAQAQEEAARLDYVSGRRISAYEIRFGSIERAPSMLAVLIEIGQSPESLFGWCSDFAPIANLLHELDAARPKPAYVFAAISPLVFANVSAAMGISFSSIRSPEIVWVKTYQLIGEKRIMIWVPEIVWPQGTVHNASKFAYGSKAGNQQCHACGHAIRNYWNWVPLVADAVTWVDSDETTPHALWVGKDCAEHMFGAKITGEAKFTR